MIIRNDCRALFNSSDSSKRTYKKDISISASDDQYLRSCKAEIKEAIISGIKEFKRQNNEYVEKISAPKFAQQGSYVYKTLNKPAYPPSQQLDLDYGVYLPFSDLLDEKAPSIVATVYFDIIDSILETHIRNKRKDWELCKDKNSCSRVILNDRMHIDLPLYACPDEEMNRVTEAHLKQANASKLHDGLIINDFQELNSDLIYLATRNGEWIQSDALILRDWVKAKCNSFGNNDVRYVCRFLKGWRDEKEEWREEGGPSSILLLALTMDLFDNDLDGIHSKLYAVTSSLSSRLDEPVNIPISKQNVENLLERLSSEEISDLKKCFDELNQAYRYALFVEDTVKANETLQKIFGERYPFRPDDIVVRDGPTSPDDVRKTPASPKPAVFPDTTTSG